MCWIYIAFNTKYHLCALYRYYHPGNRVHS